MGGTGADGGGGAGGTAGAGGSAGTQARPINVLVFNYCTGYGHQSRETAIPVLQAAAVGTEINFDVKYALTAVQPQGPGDDLDLRNMLPGTHPVDTSAFVPGGLDNYDIIFFLNTGGEPLNGDGRDMEKAHQQAMRDFMEKKHGGFVATHSAIDTYQPLNGDPWPWYVDDLIGANFISHSGYPTQGTVRHNDGVEHVILTAGMVQNPWQRGEEWYTLSRDIRQYTPADGSGIFTVLLLVNDKQFPERPTVWVNQMTGGGRVFYTSFGHDVSAFKEPAVQRLLFAGIRWAAHRL
jgi:type 1 glutamine amidotransferase